MDDFLDIHKESLSAGFWREEHIDSVIRSIESRYKDEIIKKYQITEISFGNKLLVKWEERFVHLTDQQVKEKYGR